MDWAPYRYIDAAPIARGHVVYLKYLLFRYLSQTVALSYYEYDEQLASSQLFHEWSFSCFSERPSPIALLCTETTWWSLSMNASGIL